MSAEFQMRQRSRSWFPFTGVLVRYTNSSLHFLLSVPPDHLQGFENSVPATRLYEGRWGCGLLRIVLAEHYEG